MTRIGGRQLISGIRTMVITHSSRIKGSGADAVDRFVDRVTCATGAFRATDGTAP